MSAPDDTMLVQLTVGQLRALIREEVALSLGEHDPRGVPALLTRQELADQLRCCDRTVQRMDAQGLPSVRVGDHRRYRLEKVLAWLEERRSAD